MSIVERVERLCVSPTGEWPVIAEEKAEPASLIGSLDMAKLEAMKDAGTRP